MLKPPYEVILLHLLLFGFSFPNFKDTTIKRTKKGTITFLFHSHAPQNGGPQQGVRWVRRHCINMAHLPGKSTLLKGK